MRTTTSTFDAAFKRGDLNPRLKLDIYDSDRTTLLKTLTDAISVTVDGDRSRLIRRGLTIRLDNAGGQYTPDLKNLLASLFWRNKWAKAYVGLVTAAGEEWVQLGEFIFRRPMPDATAEGDLITVEAQDGAARLDTSFGEVKTYTDSPTETADYAKAAQGATASASSSLAAGDPIQRQASVGIRAEATIGGIVKNEKDGVTNQSAANTDIRAVVDHSTASVYRYQYAHDAAAGYSQLRLIFTLDLGKPEQLQAVNVTLTLGTLEATETSADGNTWTAFAGSPTARYLRVKVLAADQGVTAGLRTFAAEVAEIEVRQNATHPASNAVDGDATTAWRPSATDLDRWITIDLGQSRTFNQVWLKWGTSDGDLWNRVKYRLSTSADGSAWTLQETTSTRKAGAVEHAFAADVTARYIKVEVTEATGAVILRDVSVKKITAVNTISYLAQQIIQHADPNARLRITRTWQYYKYPLGFAEEHNHLDQLQKLVQSIGWEYRFSADGYDEVGPPEMDPTSPAWTYKEGEANFSALPAEIDTDALRNKIKVVGMNANFRPVEGVAADDNLNSPTSIQRIGTLFDKVFDPYADTIAKCEARARAILAERTRVTQTLKPQGIIHPGHDPGDVVKVVMPAVAVDGVFRLDRYRISLDAERGLECSAELSQIAR